MPRPKLEPTTEQRNLVKHLVAVGTPQELIAKRLGIRSEKTLRKHFRDEIDLGAMEANATIAGDLYKSARSGNVDAQKYWLTRRAGWGWRQADLKPAAPPPFVVAREPQEPT